MLRALLDLHRPVWKESVRLNGRLARKFYAVDNDKRTCRVGILCRGWDK